MDAIPSNVSIVLVVLRCSLWIWEGAAGVGRETPACKGFEHRALGEWSMGGGGAVLQLAGRRRWMFRLLDVFCAMIEWLEVNVQSRQDSLHHLPWGNGAEASERAVADKRLVGQAIRRHIGKARGLRRKTGSQDCIDFGLRALGT